MRQIAMIVVAVVGASVPASAIAQQVAPAPSIGVRQVEHHIVVQPAMIEWRAAPPSLPAGAQAAVLEGDPAKPGLFAMRIKMPDGYRIPPHFHGADEHVTVISGTFVLTLLEQGLADSVLALPAGGFAVMPAGMRHHAAARGETVVQVHGVGPWKLTYLNPADDPRRVSK